jgi:hypothetical protein
MTEWFTANKSQSKARVRFEYLGDASRLALPSRVRGEMSAVSTMEAVVRAVFSTRAYLSMRRQNEKGIVRKLFEIVCGYGFIHL